MKWFKGKNQSKLAKLWKKIHFCDKELKLKLKLKSELTMKVICNTCERELSGMKTVSENFDKKFI